jgi:hypothetical protein
MLLCGVFVDKVKPKMNTFLRPFVNSLKNLYEQGGVSWTHPVSQETLKSQVVCPVVCADAPAKAILLNVKQFNHRYGCNICEQKAEIVPLSQEEILAQENVPPRKRKRAKRRFVFHEGDLPLRVGERMVLQGIAAERSGKTRKGVIGHATLGELPKFDRAKCICAEYLHTVLLGTVKYLLTLMFTVRGSWYIGDHIDEIDNILLSIKVPDYIKRLPRGLKDLKYFKGSELRALLLFYSLIAFKPYMKENYYQHWMLFVCAIYLLLKDCISDNDLKAADVMLRCFVRDIHKLFNDKCYTYNMHTLLHLVQLVQRWGPLWATSAFDFESYNGYITKSVHGTKHLGKELLHNIQIIQSTRVLENSIISSHNEQPVSSVGSDASVCSALSTHHLSPDESKAF